MAKRDTFEYFRKWNSIMKQALLLLLRMKLILSKRLHERFLVENKGHMARSVRRSKLIIGARVSVYMVVALTRHSETSQCSRRQKFTFLFLFACRV